MNVTLQQHINIPTNQQVDNLSNWIIALPSPLPAKVVRQIPYSDSLENRIKPGKKKEPDNQLLTIDFPNKSGSHVSFACIKPSTSVFELLTLARKLFAEHKNYEFKDLGIIVAGFKNKDREKIAETLIAAVLAATASMPSYKSTQQKKITLEKIFLYGLKVKHGFKRTFIEAEGNALARSLSMLPSNELTPSEYLKRVRKLAREHQWTLQFIDTKALKRKKAGAFLAVAQGSPKDDAGIVRIVYTPAKKTNAPGLVLVGKGICYDTGGTNLKPANYMFGMHEDMQGSAVALGTFFALSQLKVNFPVECWMALAMNHIGPNAYKPNDVVTASDGTTIEVVNTDAEGRMVLADTLALASKQKPGLIMDYATLTGACVYSIGKAYSGIFSNNQDWYPKLIKAGKESGERVWPFPLDEDYDKMIESNIADVKQCSQEGGVDHILASRFLQRFVKFDTPWIHIDLSSSNRKGGLAHIPTDTTGFGVRFSLNLVLDQNLIW